jgi:hypothetical protein
MIDLWVNPKKGKHVAVSCVTHCVLRATCIPPKAPMSIPPCIHDEAMEGACMKATIDVGSGVQHDGILPTADA